MDTIEKNQLIHQQIRLAATHYEKYFDCPDGYTIMGLIENKSRGRSMDEKLHSLYVNGQMVMILNLIDKGLIANPSTNQHSTI